MSSSRVTVSPAELARRRLAAAEENFHRACADRIELESLWRNMVTTSGARFDVQVPAVVSAPVDADALDKAAESLRRGVRKARAALDQHLATERERTYTEAFEQAWAAQSEFTVGAYAQPDDAAREQSESSVEVAKDEWRADVERVVGRLPTSCTSESDAEVRRLVAQAGAATGEAQRIRVIDRLRLVVQEEQDLQRLAQANQLVVDSYLGALDGVRSDDAARLRGYLATLPLTSPLPAGLSERVEAVSRQLSEEEQKDIIDVVGAVLGELGYRVGESFDLEVIGEWSMVEAPGSADHGVVVRRHNNQLLMNVVRFDENLGRDADMDLAAEEQFCRDVAALKERAGELGIPLSVDQQPADGMIQVMDRRPQSRSRSRTRPRPKARERDR
jgi:hypothetical protein